MNKPLSAREQEILTLINDNPGLTAREIGEKANPPLKPNGLYMTATRIKKKGHKVALKKGKGGRGRKPGPKPKSEADPTPSTPNTPSGKDLITEIDNRLKEDIALIEEAIKAAKSDQEEAEKTANRLEKETAELEAAKERLKTVKK